jgi:hypothetical protein
MASKPKMPPAPPVVRMPTPDDPSQAAAKKRAQNALMGRRGRDYTDMTGSGGTDNGTSYLGN